MVLSLNNNNLQKSIQKNQRMILYVILLMILITCVIIYLGYRFFYRQPLTSGDEEDIEEHIVTTTTSVTASNIVGNINIYHPHHTRLASTGNSNFYHGLERSEDLLNSPPMLLPVSDIPQSYTSSPLRLPLLLDEPIERIAGGNSSRWRLKTTIDHRTFLARRSQ